MATALTEQPTPTTLPERITAIERVAAECSLERLGTLGSFEQTFKLAAGMRELKKLITNDMMADVMELMNSSLGFRTDRDPSQIDKKTSQPFTPYPIEVVKECLIEATLRGVQPVGNQFNIIAGRCYLTKEAFQYKLANLPGLTGLELTLAPPRATPDGAGAIVSCSATWMMNGKPGKIACDIPVRGTSADQVLGKAERKLRARIYAQVTGSEQPEGDVDDVDSLRRVNPETPTAGGVAGLKEKLSGNLPPTDAALAAEAAATPKTESKSKPNGAAKPAPGELV